MDTVKLALIAGLALLIASLSGYAAWSVRGGVSAREVAQVREEMQQLMMKERQIRDMHKERADVAYAKLLTAVQSIKVKHVTITNNITSERKSNPAFYEQQLPTGGQAAWEEARGLMR